MLRLHALADLGAAILLASCAPSTDADKELAIVHMQQEKLLCVPTSAAIILAFYGDPQAPRKLKTLSVGRAYDPAEPFDDFSITLYRDIVSAARSLGYQWRELSLPNDDRGFDQGLALIRAEIDRGHPLLLDVSIPYGHTVVLAGIDDARRTVTLIDPERPSPGKVVLDFDSLRKHWNETAYGSNFRAIVPTPPKAS